MDAVGIVLYEKIRLETGAGMKVQKDSGRRKKIAIILLSHEPNDCIYQYNIAYTLRKAGYQCDLYSACDNHLEKADEYTFAVDGATISISQRAKKIQELLKGKQYSIAICDTPLAVSFAHQYARKVVYFVSEWYPSKKNLRGTPRLLRPLKFVILLLASFWAGIRADAFFYGESYKIKPFHFFFPWKPSLFVSYYPRLDMFPRVPVKRKNTPFTFFYAGPLTAEKGWQRVKKLVIAIANKYPQRQWRLLVVSDRKENVPIPANLNMSFVSYQSYPAFCNMLYDTDMCLDLRDDDFENTRCLPVKVFHYIAVPSFVIYSDLKAIHADVPQLANRIPLVQPEDIDTQVAIVSELIDSPNRNINALREEFEKRYNWELKENSFLQFMDAL